MKKVLGIFAIAASLVACDNAANSEQRTKDSLDSVSKTTTTTTMGSDTSSNMMGADTSSNMMGADTSSKMMSTDTTKTQ